jgi:hypothetical protein
MPEVGRLFSENEEMLAGLVFQENENADLVGERRCHAREAQPQTIRCIEAIRNARLTSV